MRWMMRLSLLVMVVSAAGCIRFAARPVPAPEPQGWRAVDRARVTTEESRFYELSNVQITADSVIGWQRARPTDRRIALHRTQVRRFEQERVDVVRTGLLGVVAAYVVALYIAYRGMDW